MVAVLKRKFLNHYCNINITGCCCCCFFFIKENFICCKLYVTKKLNNIYLKKREKKNVLKQPYDDKIPINFTWPRKIKKKERILLFFFITLFFAFAKIILPYTMKRQLSMVNGGNE